MTKTTSTLLLSIAGLLAITSLAMASDYWGTLDQEYARTYGPGGKPQELYYYTQSHYQLVDPVGDLALIYLINRSVKRITWELDGNQKALQEEQAQIIADRPNDPSVPDVFTWIDAPGVTPSPRPEDPTPAQIESMAISEHDKQVLIANEENDKLAIAGNVKPLKTNATVSMLTEVIAEEAQKGIAPKIGVVHQWSQEFLSKYGKQFEPFDKLSKLLVSLAGGTSSKFLVTGQEQAFEDYILSQPEQSVTIDEAFREGYRLNGGDVYLALLTVENVLSRYWLDPNRANLPLSLRMSKITNFYGDGGVENRFGEWYHLFGIMLYGYVYGEIDAVVVGNIERMGAVILNPDTDKGETFVNREGGVIGAHLKSALLSGEFLKKPLNPALLKPSSYLNIEDFRDQINVVADPEISVSVDPMYITVSSTVSLTSCSVEVMVYDSDFSGDSKYSYSDQNINPGHSDSFGIFQKNKRSARVFISDCQEDPSRTWVGLGAATG